MPPEDILKPVVYRHDAFCLSDLFAPLGEQTSNDITIKIKLIPRKIRLRRDNVKKLVNSARKMVISSDC